MAILVEGDPRAPFSIATTQGCGGGHYTNPRSSKQGGIKYHFLSLWYYSTWDWTPSPRPLANTNHSANDPVYIHTYTHEYIQGAELKYGIILKTFFKSNFLKKNPDKCKFSWSFLLFKHVSLKFSPICVSKKRKIKESMICLTLKPNQRNFRNHWNFFMASIKPRPWLCYMERFRKQNKCNFPSKYWLAYDCFWGEME